MPVPKLHIVFRACDKVLTRAHTQRPFCNNKTELIKTCFNSLIASLNSDKLVAMAYQIHIVADAISDPLRTFFESHPCTITHGVYGNDASIRTCFNYALSLPSEDWVYFCEDDYLHTLNALPTLYDLIVNRHQTLTFIPKKNRLICVGKDFNKLPLFIHPTDYPDRYQDSGSSRFALIFQSESGQHWRQIQNTTFTFLTQVSTVKHFEKTLMRSSINANDGLLSRLYRGWPIRPRSLCVSPIPSLAAHLHLETLPKGINWENLFNHYRP